MENRLNNNNNNEETTPDPKQGVGILMRCLAKASSERVPKKGETCLVHYEGFLENGTKIDSSRDLDQPLLVKLGAGNVIEGWEVALARMPLGSHYEVTIPYLYAYGAKGYPPKIPPKATLVYQMELLEIQS